MSSLYLWLKALHVFAVIAWMAGIFYLPRLFVYHADTPVGTPQSETFKVMERRLLRGIMTPAMILVWVAGIAVATVGDRWHDRWLMAKLVLVLILSGFHGWLSRRSRDFANDRNRLSSRAYRIANEIPTLLLLGIVILVVVQPF